MPRNILIAILLISWILFVWAVLLMSPKWWLGAWLAGSSWWGDYGSKKSVEWTLKKTAVIAIIIFMVAVAILPYSQ